MHDGQPTNDSGNSQKPRISRKAANWLFAIYVLCMVWNFFIGVYYALKLGSMMFDPSQTFLSIALYLYRSDVIYLDAPALIYFFGVRHFFGREMKECDRRLGALIKADTPQ